MPSKMIPDTFTVAELEKLGGLEGAYGYFFAKVWNAQLKFLRDGRKHVTRIHQQNATPVEGQAGAYTLALHVRHWLADPGEAEVGEYVYERSLMANGEVDAASQQPKASHMGRQFVRTDDGWCRMA
jgi:hypothetical protein